MGTAALGSPAHATARSASNPSIVECVRPAYDPSALGCIDRCNVVALDCHKLPNPTSSASTSQTATGDWPTASLADSGLSDARLRSLDAAIRSGEFKKIGSVLIARHGKLVYASYFDGDAATLHNTRSATKSTTDVLIGIAIDEHKLSGVDAKILALLPDAVAGCRIPILGRRRSRHESAPVPLRLCGDGSLGRPSRAQHGSFGRDCYRTISVTTSPCAAPPTAVAVTVICDVPTAVGAFTFTEADPAVPVAVVAVTVTVAGFGTDAGAVYSPVPSTVPFALPPVTAQVTLWLAVNCCCVSPAGHELPNSSANKFTDAGLTVTPVPTVSVSVGVA